MDKDTKNTHKAENIIPKYIHPEDKLVDWFSERHSLEEKRGKFESRKKAGEKLPSSLYKAIKSSSARKTEILDSIVFQSMANLLYFFDQIDNYPQLSGLFEKDIIELLDPRYVQEDINHFNKTKITSAYVFSINNFARLILTALKIPETKMKGDGPITDFRIALLYQLQSVARELVLDILIRDYGSSSVITMKAEEDFSNSLKWLTFIATAAAQEMDREHNREIQMFPMKVPSKRER